MPRCPDCDERVASTDLECPGCGAPLRPGKKKSAAGTTSAIAVVVGVVAGAFLVCGGILAALLIPAVHSARQAAQRAQSMMHLKQIGLAVHNYEAVHRWLPPGGTFSEDGQGQHGWMTAVLPSLELAHLYGQLDLSEPWNSPRNQPTFSQVVPNYQHPGIPAHHDVQGQALAHYAGNSQVLLKNASVRLGDFTDGIAVTVLAGEVSAGFQPWGSPVNTRDPTQGLGETPAQFGGSFREQCSFLIADGSVRSVSHAVDPAILKALSTYNGGEPVSDF